MSVTLYPLLSPDCGSILWGMKVLVTGARGQLGRELCRLLGGDAIPLGREELDLARGVDVFNAVVARHPDVVINCAAYTQVDRAETEPDLCRAVNATAVQYLADACLTLDCPLVQISSDYVFSGDSGRKHPYREDEPPRPRGVYAMSKTAGEIYAARHGKHLIVRTCGLYARRSDELAANFVRTMLRLGRGKKRLRVVADQRCTPSHVPHVARAVLFLAGIVAAQAAPWGIYHVTNSGETTWHDFAAEIFRLAGLNVELEAVTTAEYGAAAPRPEYGVLDTSAYHRLGGPAMPHWKDALREYFAETAK